jgi:diguanylate cyclase (GGDEF)-like protein
MVPLNKSRYTETDGEARKVLILGNSVPEGTYIELVRSLFRTLSPTFIMAISFCGVAWLATNRTEDLSLIGLSLVGTLAAVARIVLLMALRRQAADDTLDVAAARTMERRFGASYLCFAAVFGLFCARAIMVTPTDLHVLVAALVVGYSAGVASGISYRPIIGVSAMLLGTLPTIAIAFATASPTYRALGAVLSVLLAGGIQSVIARFRYAAAQITMRRTFETLARSDGLTGLPNRLALSERFNDVAGRKRERGDIAVHCLDLDRFKPVNDRYGHPVGDLLLQAIAERLQRVLRSGDFAARMGGDEFVIIQHGITDPSEAEMLARRTVRVISEPYVIGDQRIVVGTSVGFTLASHDGYDLEKLVTAADTALLRAKSAGGGIAVSAGSSVTILRRSA